MSSTNASIAQANGALVITLHDEKMYFVAASGRDGSRLGFGLPQAFARLGEDIVSCAQRVLFEQLSLSVPLSAIRYIGSVALEANGELYWQPIVLATPAKGVKQDKKGILACSLDSLDGLLASGGVAQAASLAAIAFYNAKKNVGHIA